ncbi:hypothetical protein ABMA79_07645 [Halobacteriovorax sp. HFRX-2_2]|uniref:hypothetical protein n=1 Tax=unclassified Halobacteriovorax TaxID=2639665 RepID=UPI00371C37F7
MKLEGSIVIENLKYKDYVICYLDVLGFSTKVNRSVDCKNSQFDIIGSYLHTTSTIAKFFETEDEIDEDLGLKIVVISDSIIITAPIKDLQNSDELSKAIKGVSIYAGRLVVMLMKLNYFLRGSVTVGKIYQNKHQIVGPGLISAYKMEEDFAKFPRVILDMSVVKRFYGGDYDKFNRELNRFTYFGVDTNTYIRRTEFWDTYYQPYFDDCVFLDIFCIIEYFESPFKSTFKRIYDYVLEGTFEMPNIAEKYWWFLRYLVARLKGPYVDNSLPFKNKDYEELIKKYGDV